MTRTKRYLGILFILALPLALVACGGQPAAPDPPQTEAPAAEDESAIALAPPITASIEETITIGDWEIEVTRIVRNGMMEDDDGLMDTMYRMRTRFYGRHERLDGRGGQFEGVYCGSGTSFCSGFRYGDHITAHIRFINNTFFPAVVISDTMHEDVEDAFQINILYDGEHRFPPINAACNSRRNFLHDREFIPERSSGGMLVFQIHVERIATSPDLMLEITDGTTTVLVPVG